MKQENHEWIKNTDVSEEALQCECGTEVDILHSSVQQGKHCSLGVFYTRCPKCGVCRNIGWKTNESPKSEAQKNLAKLPAKCYAILLTNNELIEIRAGEKGYYRLGQRWPQMECRHRGDITMDELADLLNKEDGVTKGQREAMETGSMFGWEVPGANPDLYTEDGVIIKAKLKSYDKNR